MLLQFVPNLALSQYLPGRPPGPLVQRINALTHQEPYATLFHHIVWSLLLLVVAPLAGVGTLLKLVWCLLLQLYSFVLGGTSHLVLPKESKGEEELAIVVTGCDSGFGKELAIRLAAEGFMVFAGCYQNESKAHFAMDKEQIHPVVCDVTKQGDVDAMQKTVQAWLTESGKKRHLHSLVNNAGSGGRIGLIDWLTLDDYEFCMNVNCWAMIRMTKAFLPILKQQSVSEKYRDGQIVNMVSAAGMHAGVGFAGTPYQISKHGAQVFSHELAVEMVRFGINVVTVNPTFHKSNIRTNARALIRETGWAALSPETKKEYGKEFYDGVADHFDSFTMSSEWDIGYAVDEMQKAVQSKRPPSQLLLGVDAKLLPALRILPLWIHQQFPKLLFCGSQVPTKN